MTVGRKRATFERIGVHRSRRRATRPLGGKPSCEPDFAYRRVRESAPLPKGTATETHLLSIRPAALIGRTRLLSEGSHVRVGRLGHRTAHSVLSTWPGACVRLPRARCPSVAPGRGGLSRLLATALRWPGLRLLILRYPGFVVTNNALHGTDSEDRALLATDGNRDGAECHGGPRKLEGRGAPILR